MRECTSLVDDKLGNKIANLKFALEYHISLTYTKDVEKMRS